VNRKRFKHRVNDFSIGKDTNIENQVRRQSNVLPFPAHIIILAKMSGTFLFLYQLIYSLDIVQINHHFCSILYTILTQKIKKDRQNNRSLPSSISIIFL